MMSVGAQFADEIGKQCKGRIEWFEIGDLRANVHIDAGEIETRHCRGFGIDGSGLGNGDSEFIFGLASRDFRVGFGVDIGVDAQRDTSRTAFLDGKTRDF